MSGQVESLKKVAVLDSKIFELEDRSKLIPRLLREKEQKLEQARQQLAEQDAEIKSLRVKAETKEKELRDAEAAAIKLRTQINQAKTNKEFQALQHEILSKEADNARLEDAVLQQLQKVDRQKDERDALAGEVKRIEAELITERTRLKKEEEQLTAETDKLRKQRQALGSDVPADIFAKYDRLIRRRGQTAMVAVVNGNCQGCFMTLRPETMAQLKKGGDLVTCHSCGRILYLEG